MVQRLYVRCIHDVHKRNPPRISNEPKYANISPFVSFGINTDLAKASILEFTGILRSNEGGFVKPGEEAFTLTTEKTSIDSSSKPTISRVTETNGERSRGVRLQDLVPTESTTMTTFNVHSEGLVTPEGSEWPAFDIFDSLLGSDMTDLLPPGGGFDVSGFDMDFFGYGNSDDK